MLQIHNIHKSFGDQIVLDGVDIEIENGYIQSLLGANGAGKSTLIYILASLLEPDKGEIIVDGLPMKDNNYKRNVGFLLEQTELIENFTAHEFLNFLSLLEDIPKKIAEPKINELLAYFSIPKDKKLIKKLSKGMKKKIDIIASLLHDPKILVLDEPFDSLDFLSIQNLKRLLRDMVKKDCAVFIASHQFHVIRDLCDKFAILVNGTIQYNFTMMELEKRANLSGYKGTDPVISFVESLLS